MRQTMLPEFGEEGQQRLGRSAALIVGLGGLGAPVAIYLAASGIGRLGLADFDTVSESNLQRQILYQESQVGMPKLDCAAQRLMSMNSHLEIDRWACGITKENAAEIIGRYDIVLDCTDNFATRMLIDTTCAALGKPWVHGSIDGMYGQLTVFNYKAGKRYADLYPDGNALAERKRRIIGTLGPVPGTIGSFQALEAIKVLTGVGQPLDGRLLVVDFLDVSTQTFDF